MTIYFGRPGAQIPIPDPRDGVDSTRDRPTATFKTGSGGARTSRLLEGKRQFSLNWTQLWYETYAQVEAFHHGHEGPGPFAFHDPGRVNQLTVNQSSATSHRNDTDGFSVAGSGSSLETDTDAHRGPRSLEWNFAYAATGELTLDSPTPHWPGIPVVASLPLTFSAYATGYGVVDPTITLTPGLRWYDSAGAVVSTSTGTPLATAASTWTLMSVTATPPAGALYVQPVVAASEVGAGASVHIDELQLEQASAASSWRPGTGMCPVTVVSLTEKWPWTASDYRQQPRLVLQEVGP